MILSSNFDILWPGEREREREKGRECVCERGKGSERDGKCVCVGEGERERRGREGDWVSSALYKSMEKDKNVLVIFFILLKDFDDLQYVVIGTQVQRPNVDLDVILQKILSQTWRWRVAVRHLDTDTSYIH